MAATLPERMISTRTTVPFFYAEPVCPGLNLSFVTDASRADDPFAEPDGCGTASTGPMRQ
jgi:hypothetical protein